MKDFDEAWDKILLGAKQNTVLSSADRRVVAYHEGGHAVVAWLTPAADPVQKVTIVPHGKAIGITEQPPLEDRYNYSHRDLLARIDVMLGGRESEALVIGDITTGAEKDLIEVTRLARQMITRWGMSTFGSVAFETGDHEPFLGYRLTQEHEYSEATAARIDREIEHLIAGRQAVVRELLTSARDKLNQLAETLLHEETVEEEMLRKLLGPRATMKPEPVIRRLAKSQ